MTESIEITPVSGGVRGRVRPPGSKSLSNRALVVAALARGRSKLTGLLDSQDTQVMIESLGRLGIGVQHDAQTCTAVIEGCAGIPPASHAELWLENSGTSIRFLTALCTLGRGEFLLDGNARMRERPIGDLADALGALGADVVCDSDISRGALAPGSIKVGADVLCDADSRCPPVRVRGQGLSGGPATVSGDVSSQFLSALLMAAPCAQTAVELSVEGGLVSEPYVEMTRSVMSSFGVSVEVAAGRRYRIEPQQYRAIDYAIEPDASAASYFFAAAAVTGGEVTVEGLSKESLQGDVRFVDALERMGCRVDCSRDGITVAGGWLRGIDIDMNAISDTAQTLAVVAVFADGPTRIHNIAHVRHKETDRIAAVATELRRLGITVEEFPDGLKIHPGPPKPALVETYDDHRMAMSFALIGLRAPGIRIANPGCTAKTYPRYFDDLETLCASAR